MKTVGFTGTRNGMTQAQKDVVRTLLRNEKPDFCIHGDCIGADEDFDTICSLDNIRRGIRPCTFVDMRAHCDKRGAEILSEPTNPMQRNRDIVAQVDVLIGCPPNDTMLPRGGTWATIRYGLKKGIPVYVVKPDGELWEKGLER